MSAEKRVGWSFIGLIAAAAVAAPTHLYANAMPDAPVEQAPDIGDDTEPVLLKKRQFVVVPIPISDPALGTGLVVGGAYYYKQTPAQQKVQPPSVTAVAGMYTANDSYAYGASHQSYWAEDKWRVSGLVGYADVKLDLLSPDENALGATVDWLIEGVFLQAKLFRRMAGDWYIGVQGRYFDNQQEFRGSISGNDESLRFDVNVDTIGAGLIIDYDTRDVLANPYKGKRFEIDTMYNEASGDVNDTYQSYYARFRAYHEVMEKLVVAWEARGCYQSGNVPLWDSCKVHLRGFPITEYMSRTSASTQAEARWRPFKRIGFVGFVGGGLSERSYTPFQEDKLIPSYGVGIRGMVLQSQRINMRLDYARSDGQDAIYLGVAEAF